MVPEGNRRPECACQDVDFTIAARVTPSGRLSRSRIFCALLPSRAPPAFLPPLGAFLAGLAFFPDLLFLGATRAERAATRAFLAPFGCAPVAAAVAVPVSSVVSVVIVISLGGVSAIT